MAQRRVSDGAGRVAFCGLMTALAVVFLYGASISPTGQLGITAVAGLFPMAAVITAGVKAGFLCWAASGILALLLLPGKGSAVLFLLFLGVYPVLKSVIEQIGKLAPEWICKLFCFNAALIVGVLVLGTMLMDTLPGWIQDTWLLWPIANAVFVVYDIGLSRIALLYMNRVDKRLRK